MRSQSNGLLQIGTTYLQRRLQGYLRIRIHLRPPLQEDMPRSIKFGDYFHFPSKTEVPDQGYLSFVRRKLPNYWPNNH